MCMLTAVTDLMLICKSEILIYNTQNEQQPHSKQNSNTVSKPSFYGVTLAVFLPQLLVSRLLSVSRAPCFPVPANDFFSFSR